MTGGEINCRWTGNRPELACWTFSFYSFFLFCAQQRRKDFRHNNIRCHQLNMEPIGRIAGPIRSFLEVVVVISSPCRAGIIMETHAERAESQEIGITQIRNIYITSTRKHTRLANYTTMYIVNIYLAVIYCAAANLGSSPYPARRRRRLLFRLFLHLCW